MNLQVPVTRTPHTDGAAASTVLAVPDGTTLGTSPVMVMFRQGGVVVLQSVASGNTLCIYDGQVSGKGIRDSYSQFKVHIRSSGKIALQSVANPDNWLGIFEGRTLGTGNGGPYSEFNIREVEEKYVALESAFYPDQHVGIREDGELQAPEKTPPLDRASLFIPFLHSSPTPTAPYSATTSSIPDLPPPYPGPSSSQGMGVMTGAAPLSPSMTPNSYVSPPMTRYEPPACSPQEFRPPQQYNQLGASPIVPHSAMRHPVPTEPRIPIGYEIMDLFNKFNKMVIIPRVDVCCRPIGVVHSLFGATTLRAGGNFLGADCEFYADFSPQGGIRLRHYGSDGAVFVTDAKKISVVKKLLEDELGCEFLVRSIEGANVAFESLKFPGHYMSVGKDGVAKLEARPLESQEMQFTIRIKGFRGAYSKVIMSPFSVGKPSIVNRLKDMAVIQLYYKPTMTYLCLVEGGRVLASQKEEKGTFLLYRDRGMGRVSLTSYYTGLLKLRMEMNKRLSSIGTEDVNMDFYVKESPNGTLLFESVPYPGNFVYLKLPQDVREFSIFLVDMNKVDPRRSNKATIPKYVLN